MEIRKRKRKAFLGDFVYKKQPMSHPPIIIFDVDGVLLSSKGHFLAALRLMRDNRYRWNEELLHTLTSVDIIRLLEEGAKERTFASLKTIYQNFVDLIPSKLRRWSFLFKMGRSVDKYDWKYNDFFPETEQTLRTLKQKGIIIAAASNSTGDRITSWFKRKGVEDLFKFYVSRDGRKVYGVKPSPGPLYWVLLKIKRHFQFGPIDRSKVAFVGDLATDIMAGKRANVTTIGVLSGHSTRNELQSLDPDFIFRDITEILPHLHEIFPSFSQEK